MQKLEPKVHFDTYLFADYSGARDESAQRKAIRLAQANRFKAASLVDRPMTRKDLNQEIFDQLKRASSEHRRVCFGQDHQYSIPYPLAKELALDQLAWRDALTALCFGTYGNQNQTMESPKLDHPMKFAAKFNAWLEAQGAEPYFYSATKATNYGVPPSDPRKSDKTNYRLTEQAAFKSGKGSPMAFNRLGDNGSVGGQSLVGMKAMLELLTRCDKENIPVSVWPFDGLSITDKVYENSHVMIEPYPTAVRHLSVAQSDEADALACADYVRELDGDDTLVKSLDLSSLGSHYAAIVKFEGWIASYDPSMLG